MRQTYMCMDLAQMPDDVLLGKVEAFAETERFSLVDLLFHLGELNERDACERIGYSSVFRYLTKHLGYSECDAMRRVRTARAARKYPSILRMIAAGELHVVSVSLLEPVLTSENHQALLRKAAKRTTREVERLVADLLPALPEPRDSIRARPAAAPAEIQQAPLLGFETNPPAPASAPERRVEFKFVASEEFRSWYEAARDLLRHRFPEARAEDVIGEALRRLVERERPGKTFRRGKAPRNTRRIAKSIEDEVWRRDGGRCAFVGPEGARCGETAWLELDHVVPWALGGRSDDASNIRLLCRAHNQAEAKRLLG